MIRVILKKKERSVASIDQTRLRQFSLPRTYNDYFIFILLCNTFHASKGKNIVLCAITTAMRNNYFLIQRKNRRLYKTHLTNLLRCSWQLATCNSWRTRVLARYASLKSTERACGSSIHSRIPHAHLRIGWATIIPSPKNSSVNRCIKIM